MVFRGAIRIRKLACQNLKFPADAHSRWQLESGYSSLGQDLPLGRLLDLASVAL
jgi:hypothetical protein